MLPDDRYLRAEVTSWLTFEQADLLRALALPRFYTMRGIADQMKSRIADFQEGAYLALAKLDDWLATHDWLVDDRYTVADIGVFGYVVDGAAGRLRHGAGFRRSARGCARVKAQPGWVPLVRGGCGMNIPVRRGKAGQGGARHRPALQGLAPGSDPAPAGEQSRERRGSRTIS